MSALPTLTALSGIAVSGAWLVAFIRASLFRDLAETAILHPEHYA